MSADRTHQHQRSIDNVRERGAKAAFAGVARDACPYVDNKFGRQFRRAWFEGFDDTIAAIEQLSAGKASASRAEREIDLIESEQ